MKSRHVILPLVVLGALSLMGACSSDGDGGTSEGVGGEGSGGDKGTGKAGMTTGATNSTGGTKNSGGGMEADAGASAVNGGEGNGAGAGGVGPAVDRCVGLDLTCDDDDNPCTEDECNPATGECGIPRTGTTCDDGLYCNGDDSCDAGECTAHEGTPCNGQTCNEASDECECTMDEHCPADMPGEWSACNYANLCVESATRSRAVTTYSCENGACVQDSELENENCTRNTDGMDCEDDNKRCTTQQKCVNGSCIASGSPCSGLTPGCYEADPMCRECNGAVGCGGGEKCCNSECIPSGNKCFIILPASSIMPAASIIISG